PSQTEANLAACIEEYVPAASKTVKVSHVVGARGFGWNLGQINPLALPASHERPLAILAPFQTRIGRDIFFLGLYPARRHDHPAGLIQEWISEGGMVAPCTIHFLGGFVFYLFLDL